MRSWIERHGLSLVLALLAIAIAVLTWALLQSNGLTAAIQAARRETILQVCRDQNKRHDSTITELNSILDTAEVGLPPHGQRWQQIEDSRVFATLIINRLAPRKDCQAVLRAETKS